MPGSGATVGIMSPHKLFGTIPETTVARIRRGLLELKPAEIRVLGQLTQGLSALEMGEALGLAKKTVAAWEENGPPGGSVEDNLRMISEEVALLESMAMAHPRRASPLQRLADRFRTVRSRLVA